MRTNIDDDLLEEARRLTNIKAKKDLVHEALRVLISFSRRKPLRDISGKVSFFPDYNYKSARSGK